MLQEKRVESSCLSIHYYQAGVADSPVILLHGGGTDHALLSWKLTYPALAPTHQVFLPNWPGYGQSAPLRGLYTTDILVGCLGDLMDAWQIERADFVGVSMGGGAAIGYTLANPHRVRQLVLVDSYGLQEKAPFHELSYLMVRTPLLMPLSWALIRYSRWLTKLSIGTIFHDQRAITDELVDDVFAAVRMPESGRAFYQFQRREVRWKRLRTNYLTRLPELKVPTLLVHGEKDALVPVKWAKMAVELIPDARLQVIEQCGHWPQREKPAEFNRILLEFLNRTD